MKIKKHLIAGACLLAANLQAGIYSDAQIAEMARNAEIPEALAKKLLDAGYHYNSVDHSFEAGSFKGKTDEERAATFARGQAARGYSRTWQYVQDSGMVWIADADGGARPHHYNLMRFMKRSLHKKRTQFRLDNGSWVWIRRDY
jgi:hypothetical protein